MCVGGGGLREGYGQNGGYFRNNDAWEQIQDN